MPVAVRKQVPPAALSRYTKYLAYAQALKNKGVQWVSSQDLADALELTSSTVRQDLLYLDFSGISKKGYDAAGLAGVLTETLGADVPWKMVVVGAGNLGRALILHDEILRRGYRILGVFDNDGNKIGMRIGGYEVRDMRALASVIGKNSVDIGIIAVPAQAAQEVADLMIAAGIRGILNLAMTHIVSPARVNVVDVRIMAGILELSHAIKSASTSD